MNEDFNIELNGKIAKFPKNTKAVRALKFLEQVKINPNKLWYLIVEDQDNSLKMVKYNRNKGVNLLDYTNDLKNIYSKKYSKNKEILESINNICIEGQDDYSIIKNIPNIILENNQTLLSKMMGDLINLLQD